jgi:hypothetical protein
VGLNWAALYKWPGVFFAVSIPTNASVYCSMVRPPYMRLGSVRPSNPRTLLRVQGGPPAYGPTDITSEPTPAAQPSRREPLFMPRSRH